MTQMQKYGITLLRVIVGVVFIMHGGQKLFVWGLSGVAGAFGQMGLPAPTLMAVLATAAEFLGGILLVVGLLTRLAALPLAVTMLVALFVAHLSGGFFAPDGFEYVLVLFVASISLALLGPGALAVDNVLEARYARIVAGGVRR